MASTFVLVWKSVEKTEEECNRRKQSWPCKIEATSYAGVHMSSLQKQLFFFSPHGFSSKIETVVSLYRLRVGPYSENCDLWLENPDLGHSFSLYAPPSRQITYMHFRKRQSTILQSSNQLWLKGLIYVPFKTAHCLHKINSKFLNDFFHASINIKHKYSVIYIIRRKLWGTCTTKLREHWERSM